MAETVFYDIDVVDKTLVGEIVTVTLFVKDGSNQMVDVELRSLNAWLWIDDKTRGELKLEGYRKQTGTGTYTFEWAPHITGKYYLKLERNGKRLFSNHDVVISVEDEVPTGTREFEFEIEGQSTRYARCGQPLPLNLRVTSKGVQTDVNMKDLKVKVFGNGKQSFADVLRTGVGQYSATVTVPTAGFYSITVIYETYKPVKMKAIFHEPTIARNSVLDVPTASLACNKPAGFTISSHDIRGQALGTGRDPWQVEANGPANLVSLSIVDNQSGTYLVTFTLPKPGTYTVSVTLDGVHAKKSPFKVVAV